MKKEIKESIIKAYEDLCVANIDSVTNLTEAKNQTLDMIAIYESDIYKHELDIAELKIISDRLRKGIVGYDIRYTLHHPNEENNKTQIAKLINIILNKAVEEYKDGR